MFDRSWDDFSYPIETSSLPRTSFSPGVRMNDFFIALVFIAMVICPAVVASLPKKQSKEED
jgi:hypothetical protein